MSKITICPLCLATSSKNAFPWVIEYKSNHYYYYRCTACATVYVNPVPDESTLAQIYSMPEYHECHYSGLESRKHDGSIRTLKSFASSDSSVLDYGCGVGHFLYALRSNGFRGFGVEYDKNVVSAASCNSGCEVTTVPEFFDEAQWHRFDVIHLGDVLEHLPNPMEIVTRLLPRLKPGGLLFVEGPLEANHSPVYWTSRLFGTAKRHLHPQFIGQGIPTHLFRTNGQAQLAFFLGFKSSLELLYWDIYETGWPYAGGGSMKDLIAHTAIFLSGKKFGSITFGNRFAAVLRKLA